MLISALFPKGEPRQPGTRQITFPRPVLHPRPTLGVEVVEFAACALALGRDGKRKKERKREGRCIEKKEGRNPVASFEANDFLPRRQI